MFSFAISFVLSAAPVVVPDVVMKTIHETYPTASIKKVEEEREGKGLVYEVTLDLGDAGITALSIEPAGKLVAEERVISVEQLPPDIKKGLARSAFAKASIERVEKVIEGPTVTFEVTVRDGKGKRFEVVFDAKGALKKSAAATE